MMEEIQSSDIDFQIRLLSEPDYDKVLKFTCGVKELDDFFHFEIRNCIAHHYLSVYGCYTDSGRIVALFTLMNDAIVIEGSTEKEDFLDDLKYETNPNSMDFLSRQSSFPAINIGHLGVAQEFQAKGIGTTILAFVAETFSKYRQAGCQFVTVDALNNPKTINFYRYNLFNFQTNRDFYSQTRRMYRIIST